MPSDTPPADVPPVDAPPVEPPPIEPPPVDPPPTAPGGIGKVRGSIIDNNTKIGLPAATIQVFGVPGGDITTVAELDGTYSLDVPPGTYQVTISTPDYLDQAATVTVLENQEVELSVNLDPIPVESGSETIEIVGKIDTRREAAVLALRRAASNVIDSLSSQEIGRTPDNSVGDAMKRVVAVTVSDGRYIALRGLEGRYVTTLFNGILMPSPEPDRNAVPLDLFPTNLVSNLTVAKSYSAELPGQFGGGTFSIDTSSFPTSFELKITASTSANTVATGQTGLSNANVGGASSFFGFDNGDRALPDTLPAGAPVRGLTPAETESIGESMPNVWTPEGETVVPNFALGVTVGDTVEVAGKRVGYLGSATLRRNFNVREGRTSRIALINDALDETEFLNYANGTAESTLGALANVGVDLNQNNEISLLTLYTHVGEDISYQADGYSETDGSNIDVLRTSFVGRSLAFAQLIGKHHVSRLRRIEARWQANVAVTSRIELDSRDLIYTIDNASGERQYKDQPGSGQHFWQDLVDAQGGGGADLRMRTGIVQLRAGTMVQLSQRSLDGRRFRYRFVGSDPIVRGLSGEDMFSAQYVGPEFRIEESTLEEDSYTGILNTYAGYGIAEIEASEKFRVIVGARYERSTQEMTNGSLYAIGGLRTEVERTDNDVLPALNLVYSPRTDMNVRAAYSYTLTRPRFRELAPFLFFDPVRRRSISGNPELITTHIHNGDLRWEMFPGEDEVIAVSGFYKQFIDPIEQVLANAKTDATFLNADSGNVFGLELEARVGLGRLVSALQRFKLGANLALMRSRVALGEDQMLLTNQTRPLYGQAPYVANVNLFWAHPKVADVSLLYNVVGPRITDVGIEGLPDTFEQPLHRVDVVAYRTLAKDLRLKLTAQNVLNQKLSVVQGEAFVDTFRPGMAFSLGLDWTP